MNTEALRHMAKLLRELHADGTLVLPNAWDAASAAVIADAGAAAIATTSAGVAWSLGQPDGELLPRADLVAAIERMAAAIDVPLTADVEAGYGVTEEEVAETVTEVLGAGAVGINIEDAPAGEPGLYSPEKAAARIRAARAAAVACGVPEFVINARTDVYMRRIGDPQTRLDEVLRRGADYAEAGGTVCSCLGWRTWPCWNHLSRDPTCRSARPPVSAGQPSRSCGRPGCGGSASDRP